MDISPGDVLQYGALGLCALMSVLHYRSDMALTVALTRLTEKLK